MTDKGPEKPRLEPEIIPPGPAETPHVRVFVGTHGTERVYVGKASQLGIILVTLISWASDGRDTGAALGRVPILAAFSCPVRYRPGRGRTGAFLFSAWALIPPDDARHHPPD